MWKATRQQGVVYLVGSVHMLTKDFYPLAPALDAGFKDSDLLVEEVDLAEMLAPDMQFSLLALAFEADITRVGTLLFARDLTGRTYPACEAPTASFHGVSHHGEDPRQIAQLSKINQYHVKMVAYLADSLAKKADGDGTLLDQSLILYGSNMGNSNQHVHYDVPHVLVGGLGGKMKGGRHIAYPSKQVPTGNLMLSVLDKYDIHQDSIGDSTGRLEAL